MAETWSPQIVFLGAGAMGCMLGGVLREGGLDVTLVDPWTEHVQAINERGLGIVGYGGDRRVPIRATTTAGEVGGADIVIVQCKAGQTSKAVAAARSLFADETVAISFQNGLGNEEAIGAIVGLDKVLAGATAQGATIVGPGVVRNYADLPSIIGELAGGLSERAERIASTFTANGLYTTASPDIHRDMWKKLLANVALSAASAITNLSINEMMAVPALKETALRAVDEAAAVGMAAGVDLDAESAREVLLAITGKEGTGANKSSMCMDVLRRHSTEIDVINGAIARLGREHGVPTPVNDTLVAAIKGIETHFG